MADFDDASNVSPVRLCTDGKVLEDACSHD